MSSATGRFTSSVGRRSLSGRKRLALALRIALAILMVFVALFPVVWIISASLNASNSLVNQTLIPAHPTLDNYTQLLNPDLFPYITWMGNSLKLAAITTVLGVIMTAMAAYAFSRFRFRGRRTLLQSLLLIQVFPNFLNMVALFVILGQFGQYVPWLSINTHGGLLLVYLGAILGVNTWLAKG